MRNVYTSSTLRKRASAPGTTILTLISAVILVAINSFPARAQTSNEHAQIQELRTMVLELQSRVDGLERELRQRDLNSHASTGTQTQTFVMRGSLDGLVRPAVLEHAASSIEPPVAESPATSSRPVLPVAVSANPPIVQQMAASAPLPLPANLPGGATLNYTIDGYYEFNFNRPPGRVNDLRAYDVLSNVFSISQADVILALDPQPDKRKRFGLRLDLQFGQATATLQGNPANETRPQIYQNIFQAYGTYVIPVGSGLTLDVGKWASSLGAEGNYTKDQMNYTRSLFFYFLPFYHQGVRASYAFNNKIKANYWVVNGTNQSEPTNGYKDEMFGFILTPAKSITWTSNYYLGQEHPDSTPAINCTIPVQPGLCLTPITPAPNGKLHIFDNYASWQATRKLTLMGEGDYVIEREWANAAPDESAAPSHVDGGAAYLQYQLTPNTSLTARGEYMSDRQGLFSARSQALKEATLTYKRSFADGFDTFLEFRSDWSNIPYFQTHNTNAPSPHQITATMGLVWWYGGKQGSW